MTSSLVGSEMCIRDSNLAGLLHHSRSSSGQQGLPTRCTKHAVKPAVAKSCLLYTSDAADDM
eukprot:8357183-Prorocentrum_lima.AAC.1